jgi:hypothetical protein
MGRKYIQRGHWQSKENVLADARKYQYKSQWQRASGGAFTSATRNGWLREACAHMQSPKVPMGHWTKERLIEDARRFRTRSEWKAANASAYATALNAGCLEECCAHMESVKKPNGYWTRERCMESARRHSTIIAWSLSDGPAYDASKRQSWYKECTKHMVQAYSLGEYTLYRFLLQHDIAFEHQKRFDDLKDKRHLPYDFYLTDFNLVIEYQGRQHFETSRSSMYRKKLPEQRRRDAMKREYALKAGLHYLSVDKQKPVEIEEEVTRKLAEIAAERNYSLRLAKRELTPNEVKTLANLGVWTKEAVLEDALKYQTIRDWRALGKAHVYSIAQRRGWLDEATKHMVQLQKPKGHWTKERLREDAAKYERKIDWRRANASAYTAAYTKGWLEDVTAHMTMSNRAKKRDAPGSR